MVHTNAGGDTVARFGSLSAWLKQIAGVEPPQSRSDPRFLEPQLLALVKLLRDEATELKDCFTRYSFQAVAFSGVILAIVVRELWTTPITGLGSIAVTLIVLVVSRLGTFKYAAANRNLGYELHLYRTRAIPEHFRGRWRDSMRFIGWEEAMRAWRVVQATAFEALYQTRLVLPLSTKPRFRRRCAYWFSQESLLATSSGKSASYQAGSYLRTMMLFLEIFAAMSVLCLAAMTVRVWALHGTNFGFWASVTVTVVVALFSLARIAKDHKRRRILEDGLLSIHSSAILWQAVVVAHYAALDQARSSTTVDGAGYNGYTKCLGAQALSLAQYLEDIHRWIAGSLPQSDPRAPNC